MRKHLGEDFRILRTEPGFMIRIGAEEVAVPDERTLPRILFGPDTASNLLQGLSSATAAALDQALPIPLFIWGLDSV